MLTHVNRGGSIVKALRADTWNAFVDAANGHRMQGGQKPKPDRKQAANVVAIRNNSGASVGPNSILGIDGVTITPTDDVSSFRWSPVLDGVTPTSAHHGKFAVLTQGLDAGEIGWGAIDGIAVVRIDDLSLPWKFADVDTANQTQLVLAPNGTAQVLYKVSSINENGEIVTQGGEEVATINGHLLQTIAGETIAMGGRDRLVTYGGDFLSDYVSYNWALVRLGVPQMVSYLGKADSTISIDSSGTVSLWDAAADTTENVTAYLDWMHNDENVSAGKEVVVTWFPHESKWRITGAECED